MENIINYKAELNPAQLEAVMSLKGPVLVIAGAGSGKTRTLVYRVARLIETGVSPENILLLTFTRKAAGEMLERAAMLTDERCRHVAGGTFHSLAHRILRENSRLIGYENSFTILDRQDMEEVIKAMVSEINTEEGVVRFPKKGTLASIISKSANLEKPVEDLVTSEYSQFLEHTPQIIRIQKLYRSYKKKNQMMDYDDLLILFRQMLADNREMREILGSRYRYIMVDEYQDTNGIQADIVTWLSEDHRNIMVVGDDSQSIYSFRGANYRNMFEFPELFPDVKIIKLEQNYRSTQPILSLTNAIMDRASEKFTKCLFTGRKGGSKPRVIDVGSDPEQAMFVAGSIKNYLSRGIALSDMAVLFRAAHHSFELEMELTRQDIPFVKYGGFKFLESSHIKDLLSHLRIAVNRNDTISWGRILRLIKNIGQKKSQSIIDWMRKEQPLPGDIEKWPGAGKNDEGLKKLAKLLKKITDKDIRPASAVEVVMEYYDPILKENFDNFPKRQKDLEQLVPMAGRYRSLRAFLDELVLEPPSSSADLGHIPGTDFLTLSTVHSAKGLEWSVVFIIWAMDGYFPSVKAHVDEFSIEEERRLMYVAATRAKDELIMCYPGKETLPVWQMADMACVRAGLSSFIQGLSPEVYEHSSPSIGANLNKPRWSFQDERFLKRKKTMTVSPGSSSPASGDSSALRPGDRVKHPAFGRGVISKFVDNTKVEVLFRDAGRKLLHLNHTILEKV